MNLFYLAMMRSQKDWVICGVWTFKSNLSLTECRRIHSHLILKYPLHVFICLARLLHLAMDLSRLEHTVPGIKLSKAIHGTSYVNYFFLLQHDSYWCWLELTQGRQAFWKFRRHSKSRILPKFTVWSDLPSFICYRDARKSCAAMHVRLSVIEEWGLWRTLFCRIVDCSNAIKHSALCAPYSPAFLL